METNSTSVLLVLVSRSRDGKMKLTSKGRYPTRDAAEARKKELIERCERSGLETPEYHVCDDAKLRELNVERRAVAADRRKKGAVKAAKTRAKNVAKGKTPQFVLCPTCQSKSKLLRSEFGGLQTRTCQRGHTFEYDKWIADRAFWAPVSAVPKIFTKK